MQLGVEVIKPDGLFLRQLYAFIFGVLVDLAINVALLIVGTLYVALSSHTSITCMTRLTIWYARAHLKRYNAIWPKLYDQDLRAQVHSCANGFR
jgi:hypothetical protein